MYCKYHMNNQAKYICAKCSSPICDECAIDLDGKKYCVECVKRGLEDREQRGVVYMDFGDHGVVRNIIFFLFACIPGAAAMSLGYMKRGLSLIIGFMISTALGNFGLGELALVFMIPIWLYSFFDGYNLRKGKYLGQMYEDEMDFLNLSEVFGSKKINRSYIGIVLIILGVIALFRVLDIGGWMLQMGLVGREFAIMWERTERVLFNAILPVAMIIFGCRLLQINRRKEEKDEKLL